MTFKVVHQAEGGISVNGTDLRLGADTLQDVTLIENSREGMPNVSATFVDNKVHAVSQGLFQDGAPLSITLGDGKISPVTFDMRHWIMEGAHASSAGDVATIHGVADAISWFAKNVAQSYKGPSHSVVQQLAQAGGINNIISEISTQDKMTHLPDGRTLAQFARKVIDHAWLGQGASPFMALTSVNGKLALRLSDIMKSKSPVVTLSSAGLAAQGDYIIWDHRLKTSGGPLNKWVNYGSKVVQEMLPGNVQVFNKVSFAQIATALGINSSLLSSLDVVRTLYHAVDSGNTHANYAQALHVNRRMRASFSTTLFVLTDRLSSLKLLDDVQVNLMRHDGVRDSAYSGTYKVSALSRHISRGAYREKIELTSQGSNADPSGSGVSAGSGSVTAAQSLAVANVLTGGILANVASAANSVATVAAVSGLSSVASAASNFAKLSSSLSSSTLSNVSNQAGAQAISQLTSAANSLSTSLQSAGSQLNSALGGNAATFASSMSSLSNQVAPLAGGLAGVSMGGQLQSSLSTLNSQLASTAQVSQTISGLASATIAGVGDLIHGVSSVISGL